MRRVLIVTYPYFPSYHVGVRRVAQLCRYLPSYGWEPVILTKSWNEPLAPEDAFFGDARSAQIEEEIGYVPTTVISRYARRDNKLLRMHRQLVAAAGSGSLPRRATRAVLRKLLSASLPIFGEWPDRFAGWAEHATHDGARAVRDRGVDAILSISPPHTDHVVGAGIARETGRPWITAFDDLAGFYIGPGDPYGRRLLRAIARRRNKRSLRRVAFVTANTPHMLAYLAREYGVQGEVMVPGFSPQPRTTPPKSTTMRISLTGSIYLTEQYPTLFLDALDLLLERDSRASSELSVTLIGTRVERELSAMLAGRKCEPVVKVVQRLPIDDALELQRSSHLLLVLNSCGAQTTIGTMSFPSKMYEYLEARRPILAMPVDPGGWGDEVLAMTRAGQSASTPEEGAAVLARALEEWRRDGRLDYQGIDAEIERFSAPRQTAVLATLLDRATDDRITAPRSHGRTR